jgi:HEAT repeat protein
MHTVILLVIALAPLTGAPAAPGEAWSSGDHPPPAWAPADTADALYREARRALNANDMMQAAVLFTEIYSFHPRSAYAADAYYWGAFARHRLGGERHLRAALAALERQGRLHPEAPTRADALALEMRIRGALAEGGDRASSERLARDARRVDVGCEDSELRAAALVALARSEPDRATDLAADVLRRRDECSTRLREQAVHLLGRQGTPQASRVLRDVIRSDPAPAVRDAAVHAFARSARSVEPLIDLYGQLDDVRQRVALLHMIQRSSDDRGRAFVQERMFDRQEPMALREAALYASLRGKSPRQMIDFFGRLEEPRLKEATLHQIGRSGDGAAASFLRERALDASEAVPLRETSLHHLVRLGDASELVRIYRGIAEPGLREVVLYGLGRIPDDEAVRLLIDIARAETNPRLKETAVHALGRSDDPRARRFLRDLVTRP